MSNSLYYLILLLFISFTSPMLKDIPDRESTISSPQERTNIQALMINNENKFANHEDILITITNDPRQLEVFASSPSSSLSLATPERTADTAALVLDETNNNDSNLENCEEKTTYDTYMGACVDEDDKTTCMIMTIVSYVICGLWLIGFANSGAFKTNVLIWYMLHNLQFLSILPYTNNNSPLNTLCFLKAFNITNITWMYNLLNAFFNALTLYPSTIIASYGYTKYQITTNIITNIGNMLSFTLILCLFVMLCIALEKINVNDSYKMLMKDLTSKKRLSIYIRYYNIISFSLIYGSLLQYSTFVDFTSANIVYYIIALVFILLELFIIIHQFLIIKNHKNNEKNNNLQQSQQRDKAEKEEEDLFASHTNYFIFYTDHILQKPKNYNNITLYFGLYLHIQKILYIIIIVYFGFCNGYLQYIAIIGINLLFIYLMFKTKRFTDTTSCKVINLTELINTIGLILLLITLYLDNHNTTYELLSWICMIVFLLSQIIYLYFILGEQYFNIQKVLEHWMKIIYFLWSLIVSLSLCLIWPCLAGINNIRKKKAIDSQSKLLELTKGNQQ